MKTNRNFRSRRQTGFTLLEMVIVLGIIALILGGAVTMMGKITNGAKLKRVDGDFNAITSALKMYQVTNGSYPTQQQGLKALVDSPSPPPKRWTRLMDQVPLDPWGHEYGYLFPGRKDPTEFEIISKGEDGQEGGLPDYSSQDK